MEKHKMSQGEKDRLRTQLYDRDGKKCHYCGIEENNFVKIWGEFYGGRKRGSILEIDRKDNEQGYDIENCVLACAVCNNAKSDKFSHDEFIKVGKVIQEIWENIQKRKSVT